MSATFEKETELGHLIDAPPEPYPLVAKDGLYLTRERPARLTPAAGRAHGLRCPALANEALFAGVFALVWGAIPALDRDVLLGHWRPSFFRPVPHSPRIDLVSDLTGQDYDGVGWGGGGLYLRFAAALTTTFADRLPHAVAFALAYVSRLAWGADDTRYERAFRSKYTAWLRGEGRGASLAESGWMARQLSRQVRRPAYREALRLAGRWGFRRPRTPGWLPG